MRDKHPAAEKVELSLQDYLRALVDGGPVDQQATRSRFDNSIRAAAKQGVRFDDLSDASGLRLEDVHQIVGA